MIRKQDILDRAAEWRLRPDVVEKQIATPSAAELVRIVSVAPSPPLGTVEHARGSD